MKKISFSALVILLTFIMLLSGCKGNTDKPSDLPTIVEKKENMLSNTVEPRKIEGYNTFEYIHPGNVEPDKAAAWRVTFKLPYDMFGELNVKEVGSYYYFNSSVSILEKLTYTEQANYYFTIRVKPAETDYMSELIAKNEEYAKHYDGYDCTVYDNGVVVHDELIGDWMIAERYFDCGCVVTVDPLLKDSDVDFVYQLLSDAEVSVVDPQKPSFKQLSGDEAKFGTPSKEYYGYNFTCKDWREGDEYKIDFNLPKGIKYTWEDYPVPEYAPDICGMWLYDGTGYSKEGSFFEAVEIDFFDPSEYDLSNTDKYTELEEGIYMYEYTPVVEEGSAYPHRVYFKVIDNEYMVYIDKTTAPYSSEVDELEKRVSFDFFKTIKISKK